MTPAILYYLIGAAALFFSGLAVIVGLVVTGRERRITLIGEAIAGGVATLVVPLIMILGGGHLAVWLALPAGLLGLALGAVRGLTLPLRITAGGRAAGRQSRLLLLLWGGTLLLVQMAAFSGVGVLLSLALLPLVVTSGAQMGVHAALLLRRLLLVGHGTAQPGVLGGPGGSPA